MNRYPLDIMKVNKVTVEASSSTAPFTIQQRSTGPIATFTNSTGVSVFSVDVGGNVTMAGNVDGINLTSW
jgi:hypothetical protein